MKKELYQQPNTKVLVVRVEGLLCLSGPGSASNGFNTNNDLGGRGDEDGE